MAIAVATAAVAAAAVCIVGLRMMAPDDLSGRVGARPAPPLDRTGPFDRLTAGVRRRLTDALVATLSDSQAARLRQRIAAAGESNTLDVAGHVARKVWWLVALGAVGVVLLPVSPVTAFALPVLGWVLPDARLSGRVRRRQQRIQRDMPDLLDVLAGTISSGMAFDAALRRVTAATDGPLRAELDTALQQIDLGAGRRAALDGLRRRNDATSLHTFVTALLQAEELGAPLADALLELADEMRDEFHQDALRRATRAAPQIALVVTVVILPAVLLMMLAGFALTIADVVRELFGSLSLEVGR